MSLKRESNSHRYNTHNYREKQEIEGLADARIITKNLVYIIGLSSSIANKEKLNKYEYLGQYGSIVKIVVNKNKAYNQNSPHGPSYSAYVTFSKPSEASIAILSLDDTMIDNHLIRASFGTTKYCSYFLKGIDCSNKDCLFLHKKADENDIIKRGDLTSNKIIFAQQHDYAEKIADIYNPEVKRKILSSKKGKTIFPSPDTIYNSINIEDKNVFSKNNNVSKNKKNSINKNNENSNNSNNNKKNSPIKGNKTNKEIVNNKYDNKNNEESYDEEEDEEEEEEDDEITKEESKANNISEEKKNKSKTSNNNNSNNTINNSNNNKNNEKIDKRKKLFLNREKSRFDFCVKNNEGNTSISVPKHILNLINKKINLYNLTKYMQQKVIDKIFLKESIIDNNKENNDEWTKFINDNIEANNYNSYNHNDEFINDIDNINHFILDKVTSQVCTNDNKLK